MASKQFDRWMADNKSFVGTILATTAFKCILQGVLLTAAYFYYTRPTRDSSKLRAFVALVMGLEFLHTCISTAKLYLVAVDHVFWKTHWLNPTDTTLNGIICFMSQAFFAHRCWRVTNKSRPVLYILLVPTTLVFLGDIGIFVNEWLSYKQIVRSTPLLQGLIYTWGFSSAIFELLVTSILIRFLWKSRTGIRGLDKVILRLLTISIESSLPCLVFVLALNLTVLLKNVSANFFAYSTASLYGLSLMVSLNCRERIQETLVRFRRDGACIDFGEPSHVAGIAESQIFSEFSDPSNPSRRTSTAVGSDTTHQYRRPSIMSFVKEVL